MKMNNPKIKTIHDRSFSPDSPVASPEESQNALKDPYYSFNEKGDLGRDLNHWRF